MTGTLNDLRFSTRLLLKAPAFLVAAVATLALGIGANTAVFSVVYAVLLAPLPYPGADRLVVVRNTMPGVGPTATSLPKYADWRDQAQVFEALGAVAAGRAVLTGSGEAETLQVMRVTASALEVFGLRPTIGRLPGPLDDRPGAPGVVALGHRFWSRRFGSDPTVVGRSILLDGRPCRVAGVLPEDAPWQADAVLPLATPLPARYASPHRYGVYGRLKQNVPFDRARREVEALGARLARERGHDNGIALLRYRDAIVGDAAGQLGLLLGGVSLVLLIACANVANLLLARASRRRPEFAVRAALGAGRLRLIRQFFLEGLLLSAAGALAGVLVAREAVRAFVAAAPPVLPRMSAIAVDGSVLSFTVVVALATAAVFSVAPLFHFASRLPAETLRQNGARTSGGRTARRARNLLAVSEVAMATTLLIGAGLMAKSLLRMQAQDLGLDPNGVLAFDVTLPDARYGTPEAARLFHAQLLERLAAVPGVVSAGSTSALPLRSFGISQQFVVEGRVRPAGQDPVAEIRVVDGDYFAALKIPVLRGRGFDARDAAGAPDVVLVDRAMADRYWPGENPVGRRLQWRAAGWSEVVGVVGSVRDERPSAEPVIEIYVPFRQAAENTTRTIVLRTGADPAALAGAVRREVAAIDAGIPVNRLQAMSEVVSASIAAPRLLSGLMAGFALVAAALALVGIYSVVACTVGQDARQFAIRLALGASPGDVHRLVLAWGLRLAAIGVAAGLLCAAAGARLLASRLYQVAPLDPAVFAASAVLTLAAALAAAYLPARAATRVDPVVAMRA